MYDAYRRNEHIFPNYDFISLDFFKMGIFMVILNLNINLVICG